MDGLGDVGLMPVEGTVVFALVAARKAASTMPSLAAGIAAQRQLLSRVAALVQEPQGRVVERQGDGLLLLFADPHTALVWAQASQALCHPAELGHTEAALALRIGAHHGQILSDGTALFGHGVNLAARIAAVAGPSETLLSAPTQAQASPAWRGLMEDLGPYYLKHFEEPQQLFKLGASPALRMTRTA